MTKILATELSFCLLIITNALFSFVFYANFSHFQPSKINADFFLPIRYFGDSSDYHVDENTRL